MPESSRRGPLVLAASVPPMRGAGDGLVEGEPLAAAGRRRPAASRERAPAWATHDQVAGGVVETRSSAADVDDHVGAGRAACPTTSLVPRPRGTTVEPVGRGGPQHLGDLRRCRRAGRRAPGRTPSTCVAVRAASRTSAQAEADGLAGRRGRASSVHHQNTSARPASCSGWAPLCRPGTSPHSRGVGNTLPGLEMPLRVEGAAHQLHRVEVVVGVHPRHVLRLVHADAVLAGDRAAVLDAEVEDRAADLLGRLGLRPSTASSKSTSGCRLPSPAWKTLATRTPDVAGELGDRREHLGQRGARDDAVLDDVVGADPPDRGERGLAALPDQRPLGGVGGEPLLEGAVLVAEPLDLGVLLLDLGRRRRRARSTSTAPAPSG